MDSASGAPAASGRLSLGTEARRGARQGLVTQMVVQASSVVATIILARLLTPAEFGIVALAQSFLALVQLISVGSFGLAVITATEQLRERAATFFWLTTGLGVAGSLALAASAVAASSALGQPHAAVYVAVLGTSLVFELAAVVPLALLRRGLRFRAFYSSQLLGAGTYFVLEIVLAYVGFGAWSVIIGQMAMSVVACVSAMLFARWVPLLLFKTALIREDFSFTSSQTLVQGLVYVQRNCDYWVVSKFMGGAALGVYYVAYVLPNILKQRITWVAQVVLIPAFSQMRKEQRELTRVWREVWALQAGLGIPALIGVAALAEPIVLTFFGSAWVQAIPVVQVLAVSALLNLHMTTVGIVATAHRNVRQFVYVAGARTVLTVISVVIAGMLLHSLVAVAAGVALASLLSAVVQEFLLAAPLKIGIRTIGPLTLRILLVGIIMGVVLIGLDSALSQASPWLRLTAGVVSGTAVYVTSGLLLFRTTFRPLIHNVRRTLLAT
jgi:O-antigen/teichoic acid export membrane protein